MQIPQELQGKMTIDVATAAKVLGIGRRQGYEGVHSGDIPSIQIGGRILVPVAPLLQMLGVDAA